MTYSAKYSFKRLSAHLKAAKVYAELSHAKRLKVGAVLVKDDRIISVGYNGMPSGGSNECEVVDATTWPIVNGEVKNDKPTHSYKTKPEVVHAEMNAIAFAAKNGVATDKCVMIITDSPCFECSKLIVQSGITEVYYENEYRLTESIDFLREYKVKVIKIGEASE